MADLILFFSFFLSNSSIGKVCTDTHLPTFFTVALCLSSSLILKSGLVLLRVRICVCVRALTLLFLLQNRAQAATELLQELNSDVSGNFVEEVGIILSFDMVLQMFYGSLWHHPEGGEKWKLMLCECINVLTSIISLIVTECICVCLCVYFLLLLQSPDKLLDNDPEYFHRFTIVIGVQLPERYEIC